jgi:hypothetical protein
MGIEKFKTNIVLNLSKGFYFSIGIYPTLVELRRHCANPRIFFNPTDRK